MTSFPTPSQTSSLPPPPQPAPRFPDEGIWPPAAFRSADQRTMVATMCHGLAILATLASMFVVAQVFSLLDKADRFQLTNAEADSWISSFDLTNNLDEWASLLAMISLMTWMSRSVDNTPSLGGGVARRGPRWAIGAWFIPIVNIVMPALILWDLARRVSPDGSGRGKLVLVWWLLHWAPSILPFYLVFLPIQGTDSARESYAWIIGVQLINALGFLVTIVVMRRLQRDAEYWHDKRRAEWQAAATATAAARQQAVVAEAARRAELAAAAQPRPPEPLPNPWSDDIDPKNPGPANAPGDQDQEPPPGAQSTTTMSAPVPRASEPWRPRQE